MNKLACNFPLCQNPAIHEIVYSDIDELHIDDTYLCDIHTALLQQYEEILQFFVIIEIKPYTEQEKTL